MLEHFQFIYPHFFIIFLLPLFWLIYILVSREKKELSIFSKEILEILKTSSKGLSKKIRAILSLMALFFIVVSLARPVINDGLVKVETDAVDVVIALDISKSMLAKDYYPNRLEFAKRKIINLISKFKENRVGVIAFSSRGYVVSPMSFDHEGVEYLVRNIDSKNISEEGTSIQQLLDSAKEFLRNSKDKLLIIFSDGGDKNDYADEVAFANENDLTIFVVGVASKNGAPIPLENGKYLKDDNGNIVITKLNPAIQDLALKTNGLYIQSSNSNKDIQYLIPEIENLKSQDVKTGEVPIYQELFIYPLIISLILLFPIFYSLPKIRFKSKYLFVFIIFFMPNSGKSGIFDWWHISQAEKSFQNKNYEKALEEFSKIENHDEKFFNIGNVLYRENKFDEAIKNFSKVTSSELKQKALYNIGNSYVQLNKLRKAVKSYQEALKFGENPKIRENLEWVKNKLRKEEEKKQQQKNQQNQNGKKQNDHQNQNGQKQNDQQNQNDLNGNQQQKTKRNDRVETANKNNSAEKNETKENQKNEQGLNQNQQKNAEQNKTRNDKVQLINQEENLTSVRDLNQSEKNMILHGIPSEKANRENLEEQRILQLLKNIKGGTKVYVIPTNSKPKNNTRW